MQTEQDPLSRRLTMLREQGLGELYPEDVTGTGTDTADAVQVTVDPTDRIAHVEVLIADRVRTPDALDRAVTEAHLAARAARRDAVSPSSATSGRLEVASVPRPPIRQVANLYAAGRTQSDRKLAPHRYGAPNPGPVSGVSSNSCVTVVLETASSHGVVESDPGWLANAAADRVGRAVTEAFASAYRKRDER